MEDKIRKLPYYENLIDSALRWKPGDVHNHNEIADILGLPAGSAAYYANISTATRKLRSFKIHLRNQAGVGYYVNKPDDHLDLIGDYVDTIQRRTATLVDIHDTAPYDQMCQSEAQRVRAAGDHVVGLFIMAKKAKQNVFELIGVESKLQLREGREKIDNENNESDPPQ